VSIRVSVVVPTYRRSGLLHDCLEALLGQGFPCDAYEVIVVDNASDAATRSLVQAFSSPQDNLGGQPSVAARPSFAYIVAADKPGPSAARNVGWRRARGEIIAFTDDDCRPRPDWLREGVRAIRQGYDAVGGQVIVPLSATPTDYEKNVSRLATDAEFVTANCFIRFQALEACGGFDERFTAAWREDSDLYFNLLAGHSSVGFAPAAQVVHPVRPAPWGVSLHEQRKSVFNALLFKKYPELYRQRIQASPPYRYYAILLAALAFLMGLLTRQFSIALPAMLVWLALTADFVRRRLKGTRRSLGHVLEMIGTSILIPPLSVFWRLRGALRYRVWFF
jgi:glycosyltransferase involved in cell wall biosynthesis